MAIFLRSLSHLLQFSTHEKLLYTKILEILWGFCRTLLFFGSCSRTRVISPKASPLFFSSPLNPFSAKKPDILTTADIFIACRGVLFIRFSACHPIISWMPFHSLWSALYPIWLTCFRAWPPMSPAVVCAVANIIYNCHVQFCHLILFFLKFNILSVSRVIQFFYCGLKFSKTICCCCICCFQRAHVISNTFQNIQLFKLFSATFSNL